MITHKRLVFLAGTLVVSHALVFAVARFLTPTKTVSVESSTSKEQIANLTKQLETAKRTSHFETFVTFGPSGKPLTSRTTEDTRVDTTVATQSKTETVKTVEVVKRVEVTRDAPMNRLGVVGEVGTDARYAVGGQFQRRLLGPIVGSVQVLVTPPSQTKTTEFRAGLGVHFEF